MRHLSCGGSRRLTTMLDYAQIQIFHAVTTCSRYQGCLLLIFIFFTMLCMLLPILYLSVTCHTPKWPPHGNRRRAPGVIRLGFNGYDSTHTAGSNSFDFRHAQSRKMGVNGAAYRRKNTPLVPPQISKLT